MNDDLAARGPAASPVFFSPLAAALEDPAGRAGPSGTGADLLQRQHGSARERRGCLFALSQPPLMLFLGAIGCLLLLAAFHDIYGW